MPDDLVAALEHASTVFTVAFSLELVLKAYKGGVNENCELRTSCLQCTTAPPPRRPAAQCRRLSSRRSP